MSVVAIKSTNRSCPNPGRDEELHQHNRFTVKECYFYWPENVFKHGGRITYEGTGRQK